MVTRPKASKGALEFGGEPRTRHEHLAKPEGNVALFQRHVTPVLGDGRATFYRGVEGRGYQGALDGKHFGHRARLGIFPAFPERLHEAGIVLARFAAAQRAARNGGHGARLATALSPRHPAPTAGGQVGGSTSPEQTTHQSADPPIRLVIDSDPGIDDVVTLALAARSPELDIVAITATYGNATLETTTRNAHELLRLVGRKQIPVHPGADRPLLRDLVTAPETHGETGVGYAAVKHAAGRGGAPPASTRRDNPALVEALSRTTGPVTLVTLGPLTNLAQALEHDEALVRKRVQRHLGMFGSIHAVGNTNRFADFNAWCDPEALDRVLQARLPTEMIGLDVTRRMVLGAGEVERCAVSVDPLVSWLGLALRFYVQFHRQAERLDGCVVNDVLTIGELLSPGLLTFEEMRIRVDLDAGDHRGHTRIARDGVPVRVATQVDARRMRELLQRVFGELIAAELPNLSYREPRLP